MVRRIAACAVEEPLVGEDADIIAGCVVGVFARHVQERSVHELKISDAFSDRTEACDRFFTCWTQSKTHIIMYRRTGRTSRAHGWRGQPLAMARLYSHHSRL